MEIPTCVVCLEGLVGVVEYQVTAAVEVGVLELGHDPKEAGRRGDQDVRAVQDGGLHAPLLLVDAAGSEAPFVVRHDLRNVRENGLSDSCVCHLASRLCTQHARFLGSMEPMTDDGQIMYFATRNNLLTKNSEG